MRSLSRPIVFAFLLVAAARGDDAPVFSRDILPILSDNCFQCHGQDKPARKGDLRLDVEAEAKKITDGAAPIVPGKSAESEIMRRILSTDPDEVMPPPKSKKLVSKTQIAQLTKWIDSGAKWGKHWAYEPPVKPPVPSISNSKSEILNPIDAFIFARLEKEGSTPAPRAAPETLIRRLTLDLTGLPPTLDEVSSFDIRHSTFTAAVTRLLASPRFGERMAWDWLDAARYADTNGFQGDPERTMWPWRDWVVRAFNDNMPYDQFTIWQLAGDLLPGATMEQKLATGFNRNHMHNGEGGRIAEETRVENVMDRAETTATIWLGITMGCARCHDHKFDPFTQRDYFGMYDVFNQMSETGQGRGGQAAPVIDMSTAAEEARVKTTRQAHTRVVADVEEFELKKFPRAKDKPLTESDAIKLPGNLPATLAKVEPAKRGVDGILEAIGYFEGDGKDPEYVKSLKKLLAAVRARDAAASAITRVMIMDHLEKPRDTFLLSKGAYDKPTTDKVLGAMPVALTSKQPAKPGAAASRLDLARWLVARDNPLTARVTVNRVWQMLFGTGLVKTAEDFGVQGERPTHPELLDWLAADFMDHGWDIKRLVRQIVSSDAYQRSSRTSPAMNERDPENRLLARGSRHRLPSWMLRDQALALGGLLVGEFGGASVKPYQPEGIWEEATFGKKSYTQDHGDKLYRRSLYIFWRRIVGPTMFFDTAARQTCSVKTYRTNTPLHALVTMNETAQVEAARMMAGRVMREGGATREAQIHHAFRLATARHPTASELEILTGRFEKLRGQYQRDAAAATKLFTVGESPHDKNIRPADLAAMAGVCSLLLNLDEVLCKE